MANIKSQKKRIITNEISRQRNMTVKSRVKTYMKKTLEAIEAKNIDEINKLVPLTLSEIDRAASHGIYQANNASRKKSLIQRHAAAALISNNA